MRKILHLFFEFALEHPRIQSEINTLFGTLALSGSITKTVRYSHDWFVIIGVNFIASGIPILIFGSRFTHLVVLTKATKNLMQDIFILMTILLL